jgi:sterol desaturase/sphingolipid hydroxylase (fatty acid hydroxylase superfamily)
MDILTDHESTIRLVVFVGVLTIMATLEAVFPRRGRVERRSARWFTNLALIAIDTVVLRLALPIVAMGMAVVAQTRGWGLLNQVTWPVWVELLIAVVVLDMLIYWQHVASHHIPVLWRLHKVHHADRDIDVTTGIRFHPAEIVLSMIYKIIWIILLGPAVAAVFLFEVILNACAMFNHANVRLPLWLDKMIRVFLVTPDMHRVHHSTIVRETNSNYGFSLSLWDRLFGSYIAQPREGHDGMTIGLTEHQTKDPSNLLWTLIVPFRGRRSTESSRKEFS